MITNKDIAYKIGFASALKPETLSGYNELKIVKLEGQKVQHSFLRGYREGIRAVQEENASWFRSKRQLLVG